MDPTGDLRSSISKLFDSINFTKLNDQWIDEVYDNEFTDAKENNTSDTVLFEDDAVTTLNKLANKFNAWIEVAAENNEDVSQASNMSSQEEDLWSVLDEIDISVKHVLSLVYLLCSRGAKSTTSLEDIECGIAAAKFYFNSLRTPGSGAYNIFHPNLFKLCVECLPAPDFTNDKGAITLGDFDKLSSIYRSTLMSLTFVLKEVHLGDDSSTVEHLIKKLVQICACEVQNQLKFNINFAEISARELSRRYKSTYVMSLLAYQCFMALLETNLNGAVDQNYNMVLSLLNRHILCLKAKKSQTVPKNIQTIKDNAVLFYCYNLPRLECASEITETALKRLCLGVLDKGDFRNIVSVAVLQILLQLKIEHIVDMIQWLLLLVDSVESKDRGFALEVLGLLLNTPFQTDNIDLPDSAKMYLTEVPIIFAILTRCDDYSPVVRTKALTVVSQNMERILQFLDKTKDQETFEYEADAEVDEEQELDVNGNHRFFWYNLKSLRERLNEIAAIVQRRIEDNNVTARKAALIALENLMVFDQTYLTTENIKYYTFSVKDPNIVVRKQMMQSLSAVLSAYPDHPETQGCWLRCVLLMVQDPENTVQGKATAELEEQFLQRIFSSSESERKCAFGLLTMLTSGEFLAHQRFLQRAFKIWNTDEKLTPQQVVCFEKYFDSEWEKSILFYLSNFSSHCSVPGKIALLCAEQFVKFHQQPFPDYMDYMLKTLGHILRNMAAAKVVDLKNLMCGSLNSFEVPVEFIALYLDTLRKIHKHLKKEEEFFTFSSQLIQQCVKCLTDIKETSNFTVEPSEELLAKYFCVMKEACQMDHRLISRNVVSLLKVFAACEAPPRALSEVLNPTIRAHAFAALGKICLQDELLAKELLNTYATELLTSKHDVIRNNLVIILIEMCKRYTSFADKYIPLICMCFKDRLFLIRYQTIVMIVNLLQEGYIKFRGQLFFCLLSTLNDQKEEIQELGKYSLTQLLHDKKKSLFSEHFVDSIFVFNGFAPSDNETLSQIIKDMERFAMKGDARREKRMLLFKFLLESMDMKERAYMVSSVCEVLTNIADGIYPITPTTECIIRDCFTILTCNEIRSLNVDNFGDDVDDEQENVAIKTELEVRRIVIVDPVVPVIASLTNTVSDSSSDLFQDIVCFLKDLLHDFKDEIKDILAFDRKLLRLMMLEVRRSDTCSNAKSKPPTSNEQTEQGISMANIQDLMDEAVRTETDQCDKDQENDKGSDENRPSGSGLITKAQSTRNENADGNQGSSRDTRRAGETTNKRSSSGVITKAQPTRNENVEGNPCSSPSGRSHIKTYNIAAASPAEAREIRRFASTPRVMLTAVKIPEDANGLNLSAIEPSEAMILDSDDDDDV